MTPENFANMIMPWIDRATPNYGVLPRNIVLAHAAFESGWGESVPFKSGNNLFNITRLRSSKLPVIESGDLEYSGGSAHQITQRFAAYPNVVAGILDYDRFIQKVRYAPAKDYLLKGDMIKYITTLRNGGYFTLPLDRYLAAMSNILGKVCAHTLRSKYGD